MYSCKYEYACMRAQKVYMYASTFICAYVYVYLCKCVRMHVCMYICMYV